MKVLPVVFSLIVASLIVSSCQTSSRCSGWNCVVEEMERWNVQF